MDIFPCQETEISDSGSKWQIEYTHIGFFPDYTYNFVPS